ncbi:MAG TPA: uracil-DNA glycosylase [Candidatus Sumerlaeota bacterium]|nr:uracil-DNA glycosylase [Candidatus Sumerlaeota bacterium]
MPTPAERLQALESEITCCRKCPRLVAWREQVARVKTRRFADWEYWGRPVPGFGDPAARLLIVGLAPAAHGGNRTGRIFTGDRSGDWLFRALHRAGFANQPTSVHAGDGLRLTDCFIAASVRCAPPENKPTREEFANCHPFLAREMRLLGRVRVLVGLGRIGFDEALRTAAETRGAVWKRKPAFGHGVVHQLAEGLWLVGSFHPSQQNTFTGKLTEPMLDGVFATARRLLAG